MREIKFRGKRKDNNKWVYGDLAFLFGKNPFIMSKCRFFTDHYKGELVDNNEVLLGGFVSVKDETMGQFTGLYDKNGKEVFEGDVVKLPAGNMRVSFSDGAFVLIPPKTNVIYEALGLIEDEYEIIGNIHENPELLEQ